jgi:hypothetical protein
MSGNRNNHPSVPLHQIQALAEAYFHLGQPQRFEIPRNNVPEYEGNRVYPMEQSNFIGIIPFCKQLLVALMTFLALLASSMIFYGIFYAIVMPSHHASERLYFDYSGLAKHPVTNSTPESTRVFENKPQTVLPNASSTTEEQTEATIISTPWAAADIFSTNIQWEAFEEDVIPPLKSYGRILVPSQLYFLEVVLELPESEINRQAGVFGVQVELQSSNGTKLASSVRASRLPHESRWISIIRKAVWLVPLLLGAVQESRVVIVPSFRYFVESEHFPLVSTESFECMIWYSNSSCFHIIGKLESHFLLSYE